MHLLLQKAYWAQLLSGGKPTAFEPGRSYFLSQGSVDIREIFCLITVIGKVLQSSENWYCWDLEPVVPASLAEHRMCWHLECIFYLSDVLLIPAPSILSGLVLSKLIWNQNTCIFLWQVMKKVLPNLSQKLSHMFMAHRCFIAVCLGRIFLQLDFLGIPALFA